MQQAWATAKGAEKMKKWTIILFAVMATGLFTGDALASPEPTRLVEVFRKPGVIFTQFKSVGEDVAISIRPAGEAYFDNSDPFLRQRIGEMILLAAKQQGWVAVDNPSADVSLSVRVTEWGRFRNNSDQNLMEFLAVEVKAYSREQSDMVLRASGRYSRVDPVEESMEKMNSAFLSIMSEIMSKLKSSEEAN